MATSFSWDALDELTRLSYIDPKTRITVGRRYAWYPTDYFEDHIWGRSIYPKLLNIFNKNQKEIFGSRRKPFSEIKCYMTSASNVWKEARPTVVASCTKPKFAQNIISVLTGNPIISRLDSGFEFYTDPHPADAILRARGSELYPPDFGTNAHSLCGIRILISSQSGSGLSKWRHATLGGLLQIDNAYYGLTAAHVFSGDTRSESDTTEDSDGESSNSSHTSKSLRNSAESLHLSSHLPPGTTVYIDPAKYVKTTDDSGQHEVLQQGDLPELQPEHVLGELHGLDSQGACLSQNEDWALIKISDPKFHLPNTFRAGGRTVECSEVAAAPPRGLVAVAAGFGGIATPQASGRTVGVLLPGAPEMVSVWTVEGSGLPGDSGSWIVDLTSGHIYGMLVASSRQQNCSYCVSMSKIFDSITSTLQAGTPTVFKPKEGQLGLNGLAKSSMARTNASLQYGGATGNGSEQRSSLGEPPTSDGRSHQVHLSFPPHILQSTSTTDDAIVAPDDTEKISDIPKENAHTPAATDALISQTGPEPEAGEEEWAGESSKAKRKRGKKKKLQSTLQEGVPSSSVLEDAWTSFGTSNKDNKKKCESTIQEEMPSSTVPEKDEGDSWSFSAKQKKKQGKKNKKKLQPTLQEAAPPFSWASNVRVEKPPEALVEQPPVATPTPVACNPDKGSLLRAVKRGDSCYEIPTNSVDRAIAEKLGYTIWDGKMSSIIETYGKEFKFDQLVRESRALRTIHGEEIIIRRDERSRSRDRDEIVIRRDVQELDPRRYVDANNSHTTVPRYVVPDAKGGSDQKNPLSNVTIATNGTDEISITRSESEHMARTDAPVIDCISEQQLIVPQPPTSNHPVRELLKITTSGTEAKGERFRVYDNRRGEETEYGRTPPREGRERDALVQEEVRERGPPRVPPQSLYEDDGSPPPGAGAMVLRAREIEDFELTPRPSRRSPAPEPEKKVEKGEIVTGKDESESRPLPPPHERPREREETIIKKEVVGRGRNYRSPPPGDVSRDREEIIIRRDDMRDDDIVPRRSRRDDYEREEIIIRRDDMRDDDIVPRRSRREDYERDEIIIRRDERGSHSYVPRSRNYGYAAANRPVSHERERPQTRRQVRRIEAAPSNNGMFPEEERLLQEDGRERSDKISFDISERRQVNPPGLDKYTDDQSRLYSGKEPRPSKQNLLRSGRSYYEDHYSGKHNEVIKDELPSKSGHEEADFYNNKALERAYIGEAYDGATRDWATIDVPPGTTQVTFRGQGGAAQEITWQSYNGVRRSKFLPDGIQILQGEHVSVPESISIPTSKAKEEPESKNEVDNPYPKKGKTRMPKSLVSTKVLNDLGYPYYKEDDETIVIEKALGPENLDEVFLLSKRFLSENATKDSKPASGDPRHEKLSTYQLPFPPPPSYLHLRNLSAKNRQTERRLAFENQIQKAFLEKETSTTEKIERIMQQFDKHRGPLEGENDDYCEVIEEHEPEQPPAPPSAERGDPGMLRTEDKIGDEIRRLERKQYDLRLRREQQAGDYAKGAVRHEVETQGTYREKQQNPDLSSNEPNLSRRDEEYTRLVNSYRADAITRGLSLKQINTLLDKIEVGTLAYKTHFLHTLLKRSRAKEQKEVTWSNVPTSRPQPEERSPRPEASPGPGILRRESTFYPRSPRSFDPLQDYYPDDVMIQRDAVIVD